MAPQRRKGYAREEQRCTYFGFCCYRYNYRIVSFGSAVFEMSAVPGSLNQVVRVETHNYICEELVPLKRGHFLKLHIDRLSYIWYNNVEIKKEV